MDREALRRMRKEARSKGRKPFRMDGVVDCLSCGESASLMDASVPDGEDPRQRGVRFVYFCDTCGDRTIIRWIERFGRFQQDIGE